MFVIEVEEIGGKCPVYKVEDKIAINGPRIDMEKNDALCIHALSPLLHYIVALKEGVAPIKLGLSKEKDAAYIQCVDSGKKILYRGRDGLSLNVTEPKRRIVRCKK